MSQQSQEEVGNTPSSPSSVLSSSATTLPNHPKPLPRPERRLSSAPPLIPKPQVLISSTGGTGTVDGSCSSQTQVKK